ncbi:NUDIX hydrolase [Nitratireductor pacificus]|uniref:MutT family NTP pyrophosphatase n=1 Tax=Nitratireductor pacificus pht-3B TaxID=391937 RepID=K2MI62_9HYPH|nr:NUDIX domain-containing protein [Nitratireductor pacificus]EKF16832.1 MutT family NTP pyrophosphatase [Nitratireductor pacificus pht-3B]
MDTQHDAIRIAAAIITRPDGMTLLVRKQGTSAFMQPGGKIEAAEQPVMALCRELREEIGLSVDAAAPIHLGRFSAPAANEAGRTVVAELFRLTIDGHVEPAAEIAEIAWVDPGAPGALPLAPLTRDSALPLACR